MSRRSERAAQDAAKQANEAAKTVAPEVSEAARTLAQSKSEPEGESKQVRTVKAHMPHDDAHEEIERDRLKRMGLNEDGSPVEQEEPAAPVAQEVATPEPVPTEPVAAEAPKPETVKVKVDGEEFEVSKEEIDEAGGVRAYQTQRAAENRLKKANDAVAQARKIQDELAQFAVSQMKAQQPQQPQVTDEQFIAQKLDAIRYGTPDEGASALREILTRTQQKAPDPQLITAQAVAQMSRKLAVDRFKEEFADIATNPDLLQFAAMMEHQALSRVDQNALLTIDWNDHYKGIGNKIRSIVGKPSQPTTATPTQGNPSQQSAKEERKASITVLPTAAARAEVKVEKELTPEEARKQAIADMQNLGRKLRGESTG